MRDRFAQFNPDPHPLEGLDRLRYSGVKVGRVGGRWVEAGEPNCNLDPRRVGATRARDSRRSCPVGR